MVLVQRSVSSCGHVPVVPVHFGPGRRGRSEAELPRAQRRDRLRLV